MKRPPPDGAPDSGSGASTRLKVHGSSLRRAVFILIALAGVVAGLIALFRTDHDPVAALLGVWPTVFLAGVLYLVGMTTYAVSWAALFGPTEDRYLLGLGFLVSQPVKYLPGGVVQPISQVALGAQVVDPPRRVVMAFPVHALINVVAAMTLSLPVLFLAGLPGWARWVVLLTPLLWASLNRRWMTWMLEQLGRLHERFRVTEDLPLQRHIMSGFAFALVAHGLMFTSFGILSATAVPGWSPLHLSVAYGLAWAAGYVTIPAPAGLGAREGALALLLVGSASGLTVVRISAVHRIATLTVELLLLLGAMFLARSVLIDKSRPPLPATADRADE